MALNIKQTQTELEVNSLKMMLNTHKELFENVSSDLVAISEKIKIVELDLEDVKASSKDIEELKKIHNRLLDYASSMNHTQTNALIAETKALHISSGGASSFSCQELKIPAIFILIKLNFP